MKAARVAVLLSFLATTNAYGANEILSWYAPGNRSCGEYLTELEASARNRPSQEAEFDAFIGGFLTASNRLIPNTKSIAGANSFNDIKAYLREYCRKNVFDSFYLAADQLVTDLYPNRELRSAQ